MRIRVVQCDDESHDLGWALASECTHWSEVCPRAKKAKKASHKLKYVDSPGFPVQVNGITASTDGLPAWVEGSLPEPDPGVLEPIIKQYEGHWCPGSLYPFHDRCGVGAQAANLVDEAGLGGVWVPARSGVIVECVNGCGFKGVE